MKTKIPFFLVLIILLTACNATNTSITKSWKNEKALRKEKVHSIFIAVISPNAERKANLETELAYYAKEKGLTPIKSSDVFKNVTKDNMPSHDEILQAIKDTKADAIFTVSMQSSELVPVTEAPNEPIPTYSMSFYGYYSNVFPMVYGYTYETADTIYYIDSRLFDTQSEELLWSAKSETYNPSNFEDFVKGYTQALMKKMERDGLVEKN